MFKLLSIPAQVFVLGITIYAALAPASRAADAPGLYRISKSISLGAPERWDYLTFEPVSNHVFVAHGDRIDVVDVSSEKVVSQVAVDGANGAAIVPAIGKDNLRMPLANESKSPPHCADVNRLPESI